MKIITKKKFIEETYNVDYELIKWLNEHLKMYLEIAGKKIDLDYHKFNFRGKEYTQRELILKLIADTDYLLLDYWENVFSNSSKMEKAKNEMYSILMLIHWSLWW